MLCPYEMLRQLKKAPLKLIIGQARKEGEECCFSDGRFPVGPRAFSGDIPKLPRCCFSVLSLSEAGRYERTPETRFLFEGCLVISALSWLQYDTYVASGLHSFSLSVFLELIFPCAV